MPLSVVLLSTYELGRQPFGLASPAAWLREAGADVTCLDLSRQALDEHAIGAARLVGLYVPMHTATRLASELIPRLRALNPSAHLCAFGLYGPLNAQHLHDLGVTTVLGGEFEAALLELARSLSDGRPSGRPPPAQSAGVSLARLQFRIPDRSGLPPLSEYARLSVPDGGLRTVGYTEASRGCKHRCRHCPIVPVYDGRFRLVPHDVVLEDIRRQVAAGAQHITFGDPDFFNAARPALDLVRAFHRQHPDVTYDVTIKIEHLRRHESVLRELVETGCAFVVSAVESVDDAVLRILDKGHTRADFFAVVAACRRAGLGLSPTFVAFHPWTTINGYRELLDVIEDLDLVDNVPSIQLTIRLLLPEGSLLLQLPEVRRCAVAFDRAALCYPWSHPDPAVDVLQRELAPLVQRLVQAECSRSTVFRAVRDIADRGGRDTTRCVARPPLPARATIPYLTEPWYC